MAWAIAVNRTIEQGHAYNDGLKVTDNFYNLTFEGMTGSVLIDSVGDRSPDYNIQSYQNDRSITLLKWSALERKMYKVYKPNYLDDWSGLYWFGNATEIPADRPACGWKNELCQTNNTSKVILAAVLTVVIISLAACALTVAVHQIR